ncbi:MAG TPA: AI-2E family transporter [Spirochaetota bacterium]|nr:AI-2E family transporter [Spirochaetota bacterium]HPJ36774.1 AI-2E family transporter [Spirochaetota bacterium]
MKSSIIQIKIVFFIFFIFICALLWMLFKPIIHAILFAAIIGGAFYPMFKFFERKYPLKRKYLSLLMCFLIIILLLIPLAFIILQISEEALSFYQSMKGALDEKSVDDFLFGKGTFANILRYFSDTFDLNINLNDLKAKILTSIKGYSFKFFSRINSIIGNVLELIFQIFIMILTLYTFFSEGDRLKKFLLKLSPLPDEQEELIIKKFNKMNYATIVGNGIGGIIQGGLAGVAFALAGIESVFIWTIFMVILAFIPIIGMSIVYIPACIYLWLKGSITASISVFIFCTVISLMVENLFKPRFIGEKVSINSMFVFFCIIGGLSVFGMAGIFYGPLIGITFLTIVDIYHQNYDISIKSIEEQPEKVDEDDA